jgi:hypothetical protein
VGVDWPYFEEDVVQEDLEGSKKSQWQIVQVMADLSSLQIHEDWDAGLDHSQIPEGDRRWKNFRQMRGWCGHAALQYPPI